MPRLLRSQPLSIDPADAMATVGTLGGEMAACRRWSAEIDDEHHSTHPWRSASRTSTVGEECGRAVDSAAAAHTASEAQSIQAILPTKSLIETRTRKSCAPSMLPAASARVGRRVPPNPKGTCFSGPGSRINLGFSRRHDPPGGSCRRPDAGHRRRRRGLRDVPFRHFENLGKTQTKPRR